MALIYMILGLLFGLVIPGYLLSLLLIPKAQRAERYMYAVAFSIAIDIVVGLVLGATGTLKSITGGISTISVWFMIIIITLLLLCILLIRKSMHK